MGHTLPASASRAETIPYSTDFIRLGLIFAALFFFLLGSRPLSNPDEGRYSEIPREMLDTGDYVTPRLNGVKYFEKPPLVYWLTAGAFRVGGINELTARFWPALFALAGVLMTYAAGRALYDRRTGIFGAITLGTSLLYYGLSRLIVLDLAVGFFIAAALFAFIVAVQQPAGTKRRWLFMAFYAAMGLGLLAKGLIAFVLPGAVMFFWVLLFNRWSRLRPLYPFSGSLLLLAIAAPWHVLAAQRNPDFLSFYFVHEHFERFTSTVHDRAEPWWYFLAVFVVGFFPGTIFLWSSLRESFRRGSASEVGRGVPAEPQSQDLTSRLGHDERGSPGTVSDVAFGSVRPTSEMMMSQRHTAWFLVLWIVIIVGFFSASHSKLIPYIIPVFPAAALLVGRFLGNAFAVAGQPKIRAHLFVYAAFTAMIGIAFPLIRLSKDVSVQTELRFWQFSLGAVLILGALTVAWLAIRGKTRAGLFALAATHAALLVFINPLAGRVDKRSTKVLAEELAHYAGPEHVVYSYHDYFQDIPVYLGRTIDVVGYKGELAFGIAAEPALTAMRFIDDAEFLRRWNGPARCFAVAHKGDVASLFARPDFPHFVLAETRGKVLFSNLP
ncbi:MAG TPA: phospholipid carrier-dependent glycosyltransferase [Opitutaceae bacterium]|nr:phospholipid carrier-dependent glycosyltransferase [Opitutaceae bacterium]